MPLETSMYNALAAKPQEIESPLNAFAKMAQLQNFESKNRLAEMTLGEKEREAGERNALAEAYKGAVGADGKVDRTKLYTGVAGAGLGAKLPGIQKTFAEQDEAETKSKKQNVELVDAKLKQSKAYLDSVTTPEQYIAWHEANHKDPILGAELASRGVTADQARASIMEAFKKPGGFEELLRKSALGIEKFAELNKPKIETRNLGGTTETIAIDPWTGKPTVTGSVKNTQSPDSMASTATAVRGQNLTDARGRESNGIARERLTQEKQSGGKAPAGYRWNGDALEPIPGGPAEKENNGTVDERNAAGYASRMIASEKIIGSVSAEDPKAQKPGVIESVVGGAGPIANFSRSETRQKYRQGQEDWVRAKLRKESGAAIPNDEMDREINTYFPQPGDKGPVIAQKTEARKVAEQAMRQAAGKAKVAEPAGTILKVTNAADYAKVPSGATYTTPDGQTRRKP